jgi:glycosyltransferase involved in cell wall biosynthesis
VELSHDDGYYLSQRPPEHAACSAMRLVHLTAGTGSFFCGTCLRDHALVKALRRLGHDALMVPMYLPLVLDDFGSSEGTPLFFGGINVYLQQKSAIFRHTPPWFDKVLDSPALLRQAGKRAGMTDPRELGEMTLSMIKGEHGYQVKELDKLARWLIAEKPNVVCLSNSLLIGLAHRIREQLSVPIICSLQGEDAFLDSLPEPYRSHCWQLVQERATDVDRFVAPSRYYCTLMQERLRLVPEKIEVIYNGIDLDGFAPAAKPPESPTVGFLARMCREKGLDTLVEAFIKLARRVSGARLKVGGSQTEADRSFVSDLKGKLAQAGFEKAVEFQPNLTQTEKQRFLRELTVLSVPTRSGEAFGLFVIEALACGVPVVQPESGAFPELIELTGGGVLHADGDTSSLAEALEKLLLDPAQAALLGRQGHEVVNARFTSDALAANFDGLLKQL